MKCRKKRLLRIGSSSVTPAKSYSGRLKKSANDDVAAPMEHRTQRFGRRRDCRGTIWFGCAPRRGVRGRHHRYRAPTGSEKMAAPTKTGGGKLHAAATARTSVVRLWTTGRRCAKTSRAQRRADAYSAST